MSTAIKRWIGRVPDVSAVLARFPVAVALMAVFTAIIIFFAIFEPEDNFGRLLAGLVIGAYLTVCWTVSREGRGLPPFRIGEIGLAMLLGVLAWYSESLMISLPMAIAATLLWLGNAVRNRRERDDLHVWDYTHKIWTGAAFATLGSIIFTAGVFAISEALRSLFGINIRDLIQDFILPVGLGFLAPLYWMSTIPPANESYQELHENPGFVSKAVAFLGTWLLAPLTLIYAAILLAYGAKIILQGELPKGEIAQLTTPFLIVGALTWLVLEPPFIQNKLPAKLFRKAWFFLSIPVTLLLAIAVGVRVGAYGLTPERIALIFCVIWALGIGIWFTFGPKVRRDIRFIPGVAAILFFIGALFAERMSFADQAKRAKFFLKEASIMATDGSVPTKANIQISDEKAAQNARGAIQYLSRQDAGKAWRTIFAQNQSNNSDKVTGDLVDRLNLEDISIPSRGVQYFNYRNDNKSINIEGFDRLYGPFQIYRYGSESGKEQELFQSDEIKIQYQNHDITVTRDDIVIAELNYADWVSELSRSDNQLLVPDAYIDIAKSEIGRIILRVNSIGLQIDEDPSNRVQEFSFHILID